MLRQMVFISFFVCSIVSYEARYVYGLKKSFKINKYKCTCCLVALCFYLESNVDNITKCLLFKANFCMQVAVKAKSAFPCHLRHSGVFIVTFEHIPHIFKGFFLLTLNK